MSAAIVTICVTTAMAWLRDHFGNQNLANKTLVDQRLLI
jgi:hypothetical protein